MIIVFKAKHVLIHPLTLFISVWLLCFMLYAMHLSGMLVFHTGEVGRMVWWIVAPFVAANLIYNAFYTVCPKRPARNWDKDVDDEGYLKKVERSLNRWFACWIFLSAIEIVFSGGLPLLWLIAGSTKEYVDFGLPFIHVFISSLLSVLSLSKLGLFLLRGDWRRLLIPIFQILWSVVIISRGVMVIALVQGVVLLFCLKRTSLKAIFRTLAMFVVAILLFGYVGDYRSGDLFRNMAQPTASYPSWLPSGALWIYVYFTTPLGNLVNTSNVTQPSYDIRFPNTTYFLFPTPIRKAIYGEESNLGNGGDLVNEVFNVSSAYVGPFKDYGYPGVACFSILIGTLSAYFWRKRRRFRDQLLYAIIAQCIVLTIFSNYLFYNPFLGQFFWVYLIFSQKKFRIFPSGERRTASIDRVQTAGTFPPVYREETEHA